MSRRDVAQLTRRMREFLAFQTASPFDTFMPAAPDEIEQFETRARDQQKRVVKQELAAFKAPAETFEKPAPKKKEETSDEPKNQLWKTLDVVKPRETFENLDVEIEGDTPAERLANVRELLGECTRCDLCESRTNIVFGVGNPNARLMIVGEAPGFNEDKQGEPFVGKAGELLNKMINAMGLQREDIYIANVLKCRPPQNRDPEPGEVRKCAPFLKKQVEVIAPEVIVGMGKFASNTLAGTDGALSKIRGRWLEFDGIPLMPTYHPAYLLRNESGKRYAWDDLKKVMAKLELEPK